MAETYDPGNYRTCTGDPNTLSLPGTLGDLMIQSGTQNIFQYNGATWTQLTGTAAGLLAQKIANFQVPSLLPAAGSTGYWVLPDFNDNLGMDIVITGIAIVLNAAIATADAIFTAKINGVNITGGVMTAALGDAAIGQVVRCTPTALNVMETPDVLSIEVSGGNTTTGAVGNVSVSYYISQVV